MFKTKEEFKSYLTSCLERIEADVKLRLSEQDIIRNAVSDYLDAFGLVVWYVNERYQIQKEHAVRCLYFVIRNQEKIARIIEIDPSYHFFGIGLQKAISDFNKGIKLYYPELFEQEE